MLFSMIFATYQQLLQSFWHYKGYSYKRSACITTITTKTNLISCGQKLALKKSLQKLNVSRWWAKQAETAISPQEFKQLKTLLDQADQMVTVLDKVNSNMPNLASVLERELASINDLWLEEYQLSKRYCYYQSYWLPLKIVPQFKAIKADMLKHIQDLFRGSRIRETTLQNLVENYSDFGLCGG